jgi:2-keto-4-pentenoate hydratase
MRVRFPHEPRPAPRDTPYERNEVLDAIADLHLAIEIPDSRYADFVTAGGTQIIADNACAHFFVLGPLTPPVWREVISRRTESSRKSAAAMNARGWERTCSVIL